MLYVYLDQDGCPLELSPKMAADFTADIDEAHDVARVFELKMTGPHGGTFTDVTKDVAKWFVDMCAEVYWEDGEPHIYNGYPPYAEAAVEELLAEERGEGPPWLAERELRRDHEAAVL